MPFSAPALMRKLDVVEVGKTNFFVVWGIHGTKMKESLSYFFDGEDTHTHTHIHTHTQTVLLGNPGSTRSWLR